MTRLKAFTLHILGSMLVLLLVFVLIRWLWYPGISFYAARGLNLLGIIIPVDVVLGPLITLIIFNPAKKHLLKRDMTVILCAQLGFLAYGLYIMFVARPAYISFVDDAFYLVAANEIQATDWKKAKDARFRSAPLLGPEIIGTIPPADKAMREDLQFTNAAFGLGAQNLPELFVPYEQVRAKVLATAKPAEKLPNVKASKMSILKEFASKQEAAGQPVLFLTLYAPAGSYYVAVERQSGQVVEML